MMRQFGHQYRWCKQCCDVTHHACVHAMIVADSHFSFPDRGADLWTCTACMMTVENAVAVLIPELRIAWSMPDNLPGRS